MDRSRKTVLLAALREIQPFMPRYQFRAVSQMVSSNEGACELEEPILKLHETIQKMPHTYQQDGKGDEAVAYLHYFGGSCDWWITEKDMDGGIDQAYGLADLGYGGEMGYISIRELSEVPSHALNIDFYWTPKTIGEIKKRKGY